jgi:hypothetical protein
MTMRRELAGELLGKKGIRGRPEQALEAVGHLSVGTGKAYPLTKICEVWLVLDSVTSTRLIFSTEKDPAHDAIQHPQPQVRSGRAP